MEHPPTDGSCTQPLPGPYPLYGCLLPDGHAGDHKVKRLEEPLMVKPFSGCPGPGKCVSCFPRLASQPVKTGPVVCLICRKPKSEHPVKGGAH